MGILMFEHGVVYWQTDFADQIRQAVPTNQSLPDLTVIAHVSVEASQ